ncbi:stress-induced-phosphoprotein [Anaeramoeba ignava]|uniref:Stress-induced-phosphoprotein n=1 Tax=Anaeramoeba ignava TaxID=1746090 RepID=A0A9Q0L6Q4_ANAIG|nr:stress-induced-phosphoprotein [Anaeramoeba ignava]
MSYFQNYKQGTEMIEKGKFSEAEKLLTKAIERKPNIPDFYINRACCYIRLLIIEKAKKDYEKANELLGLNQNLKIPQIISNEILLNYITNPKITKEDLENLYTTFKDNFDTTIFYNFMNFASKADSELKILENSNGEIDPIHQEELKILKHRIYEIKCLDSIEKKKYAQAFLEEKMYTNFKPRDDKIAKHYDLKSKIQTAFKEDLKKLIEKKDQFRKHDDQKIDTALQLIIPYNDPVENFESPPIWALLIVVPKGIKKNLSEQRIYPSKIEVDKAKKCYHALFENLTQNSYEVYLSDMSKENLILEFQPSLFPFQLHQAWENLKELLQKKNIGNLTFPIIENVDDDFPIHKLKILLESLQQHLKRQKIKLN